MAGAKHAARREVQEETAIDLEDYPAQLLGMDVHRIPAARGEPSHLHYDLCFLFKARSHDFRISPESDDIEWWNADQLSNDGADTTLQRYARRALDLRAAAFPND